MTNENDKEHQLRDAQQNGEESPQDAVPAADRATVQAYGRKVRYLVRARHVRIHNVRELGVLLRITRKRLKLSVTDAAACCGVGRRFYTELELGKESVQFNSVLAVLNTLGLTLHLGGVGGHYSPEELAYANIEPQQGEDRHVWEAEFANDLEAPFGAEVKKRRRRPRVYPVPTCDITTAEGRFTYNPESGVLEKPEEK
mgnify:CR=1 FL=1